MPVRTHERWRGLADLGRADLALAKVVEPHHDARAICHDLGHPVPRPGTLWEVWAAEPPGTRLEATAADGGLAAVRVRSRSAPVPASPPTPW